MSIGRGSIVVVYLGSPREQIFGLVLELNVSGLTVRGITLESVDDWMRELARDRGGDAPAFGLSTTFYPMHRVEKISLDEASHGTPSIQHRFERRTGMSFDDFVAET